MNTTSEPPSSSIALRIAKVRACMLAEQIAVVPLSSNTHFPLHRRIDAMYCIVQNVGLSDDTYWNDWEDENWDDWDKDR